MRPCLPPGTRLADVSEDEILGIILPHLRESGHRDVTVGPGDDAAVLVARGAVVVTTDSMVRGRDWRDDWSTAVDVGHKIVTQNLADIAAMGARPTGLLVSVVADPITPVAWVVELARGIGEAAFAAATPVLGGDLSSAPAGTLVVCVTALGTLEGRQPVVRSGARPGDVVAVCGSLGLAAAGWRLLEQGRPDASAEAVAAQRRPVSPIEQGPLAASAGATAMIDISDGLLRDAARLADASRVCVNLDDDALAPDVARLVPFLEPRLARDCVLAGGEEHSLLATFPGLPPTGWRPIGRVQAGEGIRVGGRPDRPRGWDHFHG